MSVCLSGCLFWCLFVCLFVSNKRQNGWTDRAQFFCGTSHDPRKGLWMIKFSKICLELNPWISKWLTMQRLQLDVYWIDKKGYGHWAMKNTFSLLLVYIPFQAFVAQIIYIWGFRHHPELEYPRATPTCSYSAESWCLGYKDIYTRWTFSEMNL